MTTSVVHSPDCLTTLDVINIGLSVEMFQQSQVWEKLQAHPNGSILPSDEAAYPTDQKEKQQATEKRSISMLTKGIKQFVEHWPIPSVSVWPAYHKRHAVDTDKANLDFFNDRIDHLRILADLHAHRIDSLGAF